MNGPRKWTNRKVFEGADTTLLLVTASVVALLLSAHCWSRRVMRTQVGGRIQARGMDRPAADEHDVCLARPPSLTCLRLLTVNPVMLGQKVGVSGGGGY